MTRLRPLLLLATLLLAPGAVLASAPPTLALVLRGMLVDAAGQPVPRARVTLIGGPRASTTSDGHGTFVLTLPLPVVERLRAQPCTLGVYASAHGQRFMLPNGDPTLSLTLAVEPSDSGARVVARANDERLAALAALTVGARREQAPVDGIRFLALDGERIGAPPISPMPHTAQVAIAAPVANAPPPSPRPAQTETHAEAPPAVASTSPSPDRATKPFTRPSRPAKTRTSAAKPRASRASADGPKDTTVTALTPAPAPAPAAGCGCRVKGTVELVSDPPPIEPVGVVLWIDSAPAVRDSVGLELGSPRAFELLDVPCGNRRIALRVFSRRPYYVTNPRELDVRCGADALLQPRIVLGNR